MAQAAPALPLSVATSFAPSLPVGAMGRGKKELTDETLKACSDQELVKEYTGEHPFTSFAKQRSDLGNNKAQGKITAEEHRK